jgi:hypothetical protein
MYPIVLFHQTPPTWALSVANSLTGAANALLDQAGLFLLERNRGWIGAFFVLLLPRGLIQPDTRNAETRSSDDRRL